MGRPLVIAYDVGTSGVKAVVVDETGRVLASRVEAYGFTTPRAGWVEQDLEAMVDALGRVSRATLEALAVKPGRIAAVGVTAQMFSVVPVDRGGRPLRPMLSWLDQRAGDEAVRLRAAASVGGSYAAFGAELTAKDILPKLVWLARHDDDPRTAWFLDCKEAVVAMLTGAAAIDPCGASAFRLVDPVSGQWDADRMALAGVSADRLPPILPAASIAGGLTAEAARRTGLSAGTPVVVGAGDVPAGQIGAGAGAPGEAHLSLGTAAYFGIAVDRPLDDPERRLGPLQHVVPGQWIVWLETATGGGALAWLGRQLAGLDPSRTRQLEDHAALDAEVARVADEMDGLLFAPWLTGERVPLFDDTVRGAFVGLALHHAAGHLTRAVMEGVASQIAMTLDYGLAYGIAPNRIRAVGGGGIGAIWTGIIADA
ncbi:MAG: FGGY family carbohydrate kinase, partial [Chloroflexota bacterium]|nr:FGGY family carbohydrate kinase [Chloroflexota bacterium]